MSLTKEDLSNIDKWINAAGMMISGGMRLPWTDSEQATFRMLDQLREEVSG